MVCPLRITNVKITLQKVGITLQKIKSKQLLHLFLLPERHRDVSEGEDNVVAHHALVLALLRRVHPTKVFLSQIEKI